MINQLLEIKWLFKHQNLHMFDPKLYKYEQFSSTCSCESQMGGNLNFIAHTL